MAENNNTGEGGIINKKRHAPPPKIKGRLGRGGEEATTVLDDTLAEEGKITELGNWISKLDDEDKGELTEHFNALPGVNNDTIGDLLFGEEDLDAFCGFVSGLTSDEKEKLYDAMLQAGLMQESDEKK